MMHLTCSLDGLLGLVFSSFSVFGNLRVFLKNTMHISVHVLEKSLSSLLCWCDDGGEWLPKVELGRGLTRSVIHKMRVKWLCHELRVFVLDVALFCLMQCCLGWKYKSVYLLIFCRGWKPILCWCYFSRRGVLCVLVELLLAVLSSVCGSLCTKCGVFENTLKGFADRSQRHFGVTWQYWIDKVFSTGYATQGVMVQRRSGYISILRRLAQFGIQEVNLEEQQPGLVILLTNNQFPIEELVSAILPTDEELVEAIPRGREESAGVFGLSVADIFHECMVWWQWLMFEGDLCEVLEQLADMTSLHGVGGAVWGYNDSAYRCRTCEHDPTCTICVSALGLFKRMEDEDCDPTVYTYTMLISALFKEHKKETALKLWDKMIDKGIRPTPAAFRALSPGFFLSGKVTRAYKILDELAPMSIVLAASFEDMVNVLCKVSRIRQTCKLADGVIDRGREIPDKVNTLLVNAFWKAVLAVLAVMYADAGAYTTTLLISLQHYLVLVSSNRVDFAGMIADIKAASEELFVLFHGYAHNPTVIDPTPEQWKEIADVILKNHIPFFDIACKGFASGSFDEDATSVRMLAARGMELLVAQSYSKNIGLYRKRIGAIKVLLLMIFEGKDL